METSSLVGVLMLIARLETELLFFVRLSSFTSLSWLGDEIILWSPSSSLATLDKELGSLGLDNWLMIRLRDTKFKLKSYPLLRPRCLLKLIVHWRIVEALSPSTIPVWRASGHFILISLMCFWVWLCPPEVIDWFRADFEVHDRWLRLTTFGVVVWVKSAHKC